MGDPRKFKKRWESPTHPWVKGILTEELNLVGKYGLRNKKELWIAKTILKKIRAYARALLSLEPKEAEIRAKTLARRVFETGLVESESATIDDILSLKVEDILERRLQTIVYRKGLAKSIYHARQLITHGHIAIDNLRVTSPGYLVSRDEESKISYYYNSPYFKKAIAQRSEKNE